MDATYHPTLDRPEDQLRFALGDTNMDAPLLPDVTYTARLAAHDGDVDQASVDVARALVNRFAHEPTRLELADGAGTVSWGDRLGGWNALIRAHETSTGTTTGSGTGGVGLAFAVAGPTRARNSAR